MERAAPNSSDTRLLLTHDSPHRGANTPLGLQAHTRQAYATVAVQSIGGANLALGLFGWDIFPEIFEANSLLNASATEQLLLVRAMGLGIGPSAVFWSRFNTFINNDYQSMVSGTFPYRFVATSLGSQCGNGSLNPYDELLRFEYSSFFSPPPWISRSTYKTEVVVNALPNAGRVERISSLRVYAEVRILSYFTHRSYVTNFTFDSPSNNPVAWDGLPGGTQSVSDNIGRVNVPLINVSQGWYFNVPNPARETVDVHLDNPDAARPVTVRLFDGYGQLRAEQVSRGEATLRLRTDQLPAGLYFVHLLRGSQVLKREQLRIEK